MARIRSVKPNLFSSYSIASLAIPARYLFIGLWTEADDEGRLIDSPKRIAGAIFPHDEKITEKHVNGWLDDLARVGCILRYSSDEGRYISVPEWVTHQRISHAIPSTFPPPSGESPESLRPERERDKEREREARSTLARQFSEFYENYPLKKSRVDAERAFVKAAAKIDPVVLIAAAKAYRDDPTRDPKYTKYPATWLNKECWLDESTPQVQVISPETREQRAKRERRQRLERQLAQAENAGETDLINETRTLLEASA